MIEGSQLDAGLSGELRVEPQHVDCELHFVDDALSGTMAARKKLQVGDVIESTVSIPVVHRLLGVEFSAEMFGHHVPMFHDGMFLTGHEGRHRDPHVAVTFDVPTVIAGVESRQGGVALMRGLALDAAVLLFSVDSAARLAASSHNLVATCAREGVASGSGLPTSDVGTRTGAIQRVSTKFLSMLGQIRLHHSERLAAFLAREVYDFATWCWNRFVEAKRASARKAAEALICAWVRSKRSAAVLTVLLDRHGLTPLCGSKGGLAVPFGVVKEI